MKKKLAASTLFLAVSSTSALANPTLAERIAELEEQLKGMEQLRQTVGELKVQLKEQSQETRKAVMAADASTKAAKDAQDTAKKYASKKPDWYDEISPAHGDRDFGQGFVEIPGTSSAFKFGGYAKADFIYDVGMENGNQYFANFSNIPLDGSADAERDGNFNAHVRQTRLNITTLTDTGEGDFKTFFEIDAFGNIDNGTELFNNGHAIRIRHAFGSWNGLLAGQTWTTFMDMSVWPETLDFIGPAGLTLMRNTLVRYNDDINDELSYTIGFENPEVGIHNETGGDNIESDSLRPDLTAALTWNQPWGHASLRGLLTDQRVTNNTDRTTDSETGYALALSSRINFGKDNLRLRAFGGDGAGRYIFELSNQSTNAVAAINAANQQLTSSFYGAHGSYQHYWSDQWRSNLMGGFVEIDNDTASLGTLDVNKRIWSAHANLFYQPLERFKVGVEYMHGFREQEDGDEGELNRMQMSFIYNF